MDNHIYVNVSYWENKSLLGFQAVIKTRELNRTRMILFVMDKLVGKKGESPVMDMFMATPEQVEYAKQGFCEYIEHHSAAVS